MDFNVNQLVRSAVVLTIGLPISLAILAQVPVEAEKTESEKLKAALTEPCLRYALTKRDSKGEREAKNDIEELVDDADFRETCKWVLG